MCGLIRYSRGLLSFLKERIPMLSVAAAALAQTQNSGAQTVCHARVCGSPLLGECFNTSSYGSLHIPALPEPTPHCLSHHLQIHHSSGQVSLYSATAGGSIVLTRMTWRIPWAGERYQMTRPDAPTPHREACWVLLRSLHVLLLGLAPQR